MSLSVIDVWYSPMDKASFTMVECNRCQHRWEVRDDDGYHVKKVGRLECPQCTDTRAKHFAKLVAEALHHINSLCQETDHMEYQMANTSRPDCDYFNNVTLLCDHGLFSTECPCHCHQGECKHQ